jgi:hypothetical protein
LQRNLVQRTANSISDKELGLKNKTISFLWKKIRKLVGDALTFFGFKIIEDGSYWIPRLTKSKSSLTNQSGITRIGNEERSNKHQIFWSVKLKSNPSNMTDTFWHDC